ncbi:uncharacterized protein LOC131936588 [Physella acuta]|uniref:uncharacterized protein LOC131936588 n=1 Tax=Physella acuta TaxID=109671 RepID=UPI0027DDE663|nr:uncharacterized protein LOC131936588 [Physella acuta]
MTLTVCATPEADPSTFLTDRNETYAQYTCRSGYRLHSGDMERSCDANGTWSGSQPICVVDSVLPKAYLVVLIVGATVAVFLACIPYDFYRFRKRKKKVRDHQERLSLVTRIAPGHAKVVVETVPTDHDLLTHGHPRRFGLKSLFSVFRFVGGKMKHAHNPADAVNQTCAEEGVEETRVEPEAGVEPEKMTASSYVFSPEPSTTGAELPSGAGATDSLDIFETVRSRDETPEVVSHHGDLRLVPSVTTLPEDLRPAPKKGWLMFKRANEISARQPDRKSHADANDARGSDVSGSGPSQPAIVQVTSMKEIVVPGADKSRGSPPGAATSPSPVLSPTPSTSSPDMGSLRNLDTNYRTFSFSRKDTNAAYHSMPLITDSP